jgi:hypothetical protein
MNGWRWCCCDKAGRRRGCTNAQIRDWQPGGQGRKHGAGLRLGRCKSLGDLKPRLGATAARMGELCPAPSGCCCAAAAQRSTPCCGQRKCAVSPVPSRKKGGAFCRPSVSMAMHCRAEERGAFTTSPVSRDPADPLTALTDKLDYISQGRARDRRGMKTRAQRKASRGPWNMRCHWGLLTRWGVLRVRAVRCVIGGLRSARARGPAAAQRLRMAG